MKDHLDFGRRLKEVRQARRIGIKRLAPDLGVTYTYLSKIENNKAVPSADLVNRMATYFEEGSDELLILADRIPEDVRRILRERPQEALDYLRERFGRDGSEPGA